MMEIDNDLDKHKCLACQQTITGLMNYVQHKQKECSALKTKHQLPSSQGNLAGNAEDGEAEEILACVTRRNFKSEGPDDFVEEEECISRKQNSGIRVSNTNDNLPTTSFRDFAIEVKPLVNVDCFSTEYDAMTNLVLFSESVSQEQLNEIDFESFFKSLQLKSKVAVSPERIGEKDCLSGKKNALTPSGSIFDQSKQMNLSNMFNSLDFDTDSDSFLPSDADDLLNFSDGEEQASFSKADNNNDKLIQSGKFGKQNGKFEKKFPGGKLASIKKKVDVAGPELNRNKKIGSRSAGKLRNWKSGEKKIPGKWRPGEKPNLLPKYRRHAASHGKSQGDEEEEEEEEEEEGDGRKDDEKKQDLKEETEKETKAVEEDSDDNDIVMMPKEDSDDNDIVMMPKENNEDIAGPDVLNESLISIDNSKVIQAKKKIRDYNNYFCSVCKKSFVNKSSWTYHMGSRLHKKRVGLKRRKIEDNEVGNVEQGTPIEKMECEWCDKVFLNKYNYVKHLSSTLHARRASYSGNNLKTVDVKENLYSLMLRMKPFQCRPCQFYSTNSELFHEHLNNPEHARTIDSIVGPFVCVHCKYVSKHNADMAYHVTSKDHVEHHQSLRKPCVLKERRSRVVCTHCQKTVHSVSQLLAHTNLCWKRHLEPETPEHVSDDGRKCAYCDATFNTHTNLLVHIRRKHTHERPFSCSFCNKSFADNGTLATHKLSIQHQYMVGMSKLNKDADDSRIDADSMNEETVETTMNNNNFELIQTVHMTVQEIKTEIEEEVVEEVDDEEMREIEATISLTANEIISARKSTSKRKCNECDFDADRYSVHCRHPKKSARKSVSKTYSAKRECDECDFVAERYSDLCQHRKEAHPQSVECTICGSVFINQERYEQHCLSRQHLNKLEEFNSGGGQLFPCSRCSKKFYSAKSLYLHDVNHQLADARQGKELHDHLEAACLKLIKKEARLKNGLVDCPECGKQLSKAGILPHLRNHAGNLPFKCSICSKAFADAGQMRRHLKVHLGINYYKCGFCGRDFNKKPTLESHLRREHPQEMNLSMISTHLCNYCGRKFLHLSQLNAHSKLHDKQLKCGHPGCRMVFRYQSELRNHMQTHTLERKHLCDECGYAGKTRHQLRRHARQHSSEKRYRCEHCSYRTTLVANLRRHERVHNGSKPYHCPYCEYACNTQENLRKHILKTQRHAGLPVYPCNLCNDFGSNSSNEFQEHLEVVHKMERNQLPSVVAGLYQCTDKPFRKIMHVIKEENGKIVQMSV